MKRKILFFSIVLVLLFSFFVGCDGKSQEIIQGKSATYSDNLPTDGFYYDDGISSNGAYNSKYYYRNDSLIMPFADPSGIYVTEGDEKGYYYAYGTSGNVGDGFLSYKTKDFANWLANGVAYKVDAKSWDINNFWAPEVIYNEQEKLYYMYYNAISKNVLPNSTSQFDGFYMGICVSEKPQGPFVDYRKYFGEKNDTPYDISKPAINFAEHFAEMKIDFSGFTCMSWSAIDFSPFIDDSGELYMYFVKHQDSNTFDNSIWGIKMKNFVTPEYKTVKRLLTPRFAYIDEDDRVKEEDRITSEGNAVNEGPFMIAHTTKKANGELVKKYYLTYSAFGYSDRKYRVNFAVSDSPLGPFRKATEFMPMHGIDLSWKYVSGTGHHSFMYANNDIYMIYHAHNNREEGGGNPRYIAVDRVEWTYEESLGVDILHSNGPSYNLNPLPSSASNITNLTPSAAVSATSNNNKSFLLSDKIIPLHDYDESRVFAFEGSNKITIEFDNYKDIEQIFIYNGKSYDKAFKCVDKIDMFSENKVYRIENLSFNKEYFYDDDGSIHAGAPCMASFNALKVNKIEITISQPLSSDGSIAVGDIWVMGK